MFFVALLDTVIFPFDAKTINVVQRKCSFTNSIVGNEMEWNDSRRDTKLDGTFKTTFITECILVNWVTSTEHYNLYCCSKALT